MVKKKIIKQVKEDSKQLLYFKLFDKSLVEDDIEYKGGNDYFCKKLNKGLTL